MVVWSKRSGKGSLWINHDLMKGNNSFITWSMQIYNIISIASVFSIIPNKIARLDNKVWPDFVRFIFPLTSWFSCHIRTKKNRKRTNEKPARKCKWFCIHLGGIRNQWARVCASKPTISVIYLIKTNKKIVQNSPFHINQIAMKLWQSPDFIRLKMGRMKSRRPMLRLQYME